MPTEPDINIHGFARNSATVSKLRLNAVSGAVRQALTPTPISARSVTRLAKSPANANATAPLTATARNAI